MKVRAIVLVLTGAAMAAVLGVGLSLYKFGSSDSPFAPSLERGAVLAAVDYRLSGPYAHDNLTVYLIHGPASLPEQPYLTLQEALEQKKVVVHETGEVNALSIENRSDEPVLVQAGDVVKGGQQDRTFPYDFIAPAQFGKLPIDAFCVEQGRWSKRGEEESDSFSSSCFGLSSKSLKLAAANRSQSDVWSHVDRVKRKLSSNLGEAVDSSESMSSYALARESTSLHSAILPYLEALEELPYDKQDVLGMAVVVNGKVTSADVYACRGLFIKLWPKLLHGAATEAFAELKKGEAFTPASGEAVKTFLLAAEQGKPTNEAVTQWVYVHVQESAEQILFDTCDRQRGNLVIHRSVVAR
jgi:hypothetical protein